jgi:hypothetical protein
MATGHHIHLVHGLRHCVRASPAVEKGLERVEAFDGLWRLQQMPHAPGAGQTEPQAQGC